MSSVVGFVRQHQVGIVVGAAVGLVMGYYMLRTVKERRMPAHTREKIQALRALKRSLRKIFDQLDKSHIGAISFGELQKGLMGDHELREKFEALIAHSDFAPIVAKPEFIRQTSMGRPNPTEDTAWTHSLQLFDSIDKDHSGTITADEFFFAMSLELRCWEVFQHADKNGDGVLSKEELTDAIAHDDEMMDLLKASGKIAAGHFGLIGGLIDFDTHELDAHSFHGLFKGHDKAVLHIAKKKTIFDCLDLNHDGGITLPEFIDALKPMKTGKSKAH